MITGILLQGFKTSFFTSILIGILLLLVPLLKKRYRANWRYIVWLVIAVRLLIPMDISLPQSPFKVELPEQVEAVVYTPAMNKLQVFDDTISNPSMNRQDPIEALLEPDDGSQYMETYEVIPEPESSSALASFTLMEIAGYIWFAGFIVFMLFQICSYQIFLYRIKKSQIEIVPDNIKETVSRLGMAMGLRNLPVPSITNVVDAPVLVGLLKPRILLPHTQYGNEELSFILRHELVHYQRRDMLYRLILMTANALHWFNPLVYLMTVQAAKDIELVCDDVVIRELDDESRVRYGNTILSTLPRKRRLEPMFSTHFGSSKKNIKDRLRNLFDTTAKRRGVAALCAVIICTIIATNIVTIGYAADSISTKETIHPSVAHELNGAIAETVSNETGNEQKALQNMTVRANAHDGTWAAASSIEGKTWQEQISEEIKWISDTYEENETGFTITEALPKQEVSKVSRINYLYDNSNIFRDMSRMDSGVYVVEDGQFFTGSGFTLTTDTIHRTVVMVDNNNDLYLDVDYKLTTGKMAVWLIDPDGKTVYQGGLNSSYKGSRTVPGKKGLWSVVRIFQGNDNLSMSGNIAVTLRQNGITPASPIPATDITSPSIENGQPYFQIVSKNGKNVANSGSFLAKTGQKLTITAESSIKGGTVDLFLFSPTNTEQRFTFDGNNKTVTVELTAGTWAYNCTGFYDSGDIAITGIFDGGVSESKSYVGEQSLNSGTEKYDNEAIRRMNSSGTWGDYIEQLLPNMSPSAVEAVVDIYLERHLFKNITTPDAARHVAATIAPALEYMTKEASESAEKKITAYY